MKICLDLLVQYSLPKRTTFSERKNTLTHIFVSTSHTTLAGLKWRALLTLVLWCCLTWRHPNSSARCRSIGCWKAVSPYFDQIVLHVDWADEASWFRRRLQKALSIHWTVSANWPLFSRTGSSCFDWIVWLDQLDHTLHWWVLARAIQGKIRFRQGMACDNLVGQRYFGRCWNSEIWGSNAFHVGNFRQICQQIVWAILKSSDTTHECNHLNFKNHPSVASELVKFLVINTSLRQLKSSRHRLQSLQVKPINQEEIDCCRKSIKSGRKEGRQGQKVECPASQASCQAQLSTLRHRAAGDFALVSAFQFSSPPSTKVEPLSERMTLILWIDGSLS